MGFKRFRRLNYNRILILEKFDFGNINFFSLNLIPIYYITILIINTIK